MRTQESKRAKWIQEFLTFHLTRELPVPDDAGVKRDKTAGTLAGSVTIWKGTLMD